MKKNFLFLAVLFSATVMNLQAENVYLKLTAATSWWANDGAKIGALFKVGTDPMDFGMYAEFFTLVPGTTDTYVGTVPENAEPFVAVQFLRYNPAAETPDEQNYWNATGLETWDGVNDMFTATGSGDTWDSTTGKWSKYGQTGPAKDEQFTIEDVNYVVTSITPFEAQVADNRSYAGNGIVVIPDTVEYKSTKLAVTAIASNAFKNNANITSVVIPGTIDTISMSAFYNCASLKVVKLNEGVKYLRETSFNRTHLDSIFFPASLTKFTGDLSKQMETDVKWFEVAAGNAEASSVDGVLFNANANVLLYFPVASERSEYAVPTGVDTIAQYAASMDTNLVSVKMPDVVIVEEGAFAECGKLASVEFSDAIDSIGAYGFFMDTVLTTITCPAIVPPALGEMVFEGISDLSKITLYVPAESVATYQAADTWKEMNVQAIQESGIQNVNANVNANRKEMRKGQLLIIRDNKTYNAQGAVVK